MKTITYEEFIKIAPFGLRESFNQHFDNTHSITAIDVLEMGITIPERFRITLCTKFISAETLHEFGCLCAERVLARIYNPDPRSVAAIAAKRKWMKGEISDIELNVAWDDAKDAADELDELEQDEIRYSAYHAAKYAADLRAMDAANESAWYSSAQTIGVGEHKWQLDTLIKLLEEEQAL